MTKETGKNKEKITGKPMHETRAYVLCSVTYEVLGVYVEKIPVIKLWSRFHNKLNIRFMIQYYVISKYFLLFRYLVGNSRPSCQWYFVMQVNVCHCSICVVVRNRVWGWLCCVCMDAVCSIVRSHLRVVCGSMLAALPSIWALSKPSCNRRKQLSTQRRDINKQTSTTSRLVQGVTGGGHTGWFAGCQVPSIFRLLIKVLPWCQ